MEITSLDLTILEKELQPLADGHVQKVYQRGEELTVEIYVPGDEKKRLVIGTSYCFLSNYKRENPQKPPGFCMELRKQLGAIDSIEQRGFDRILEIQSGDVKLVCEMFGKGNFILVKDGKIIGALRQEEWADRAILVGEEYQYPEPATDPRQKDYFDAMSEGELVRRIASDLSLGGKYAEEICYRTGIQKDRQITDLEEDEKDTVRQELDRMFEEAEEPDPVLYVEDLPERAAPFRLETYSEYDSEEFDTFSRALDEYFYRREQREEEIKKREAYQERKEGLERQLEQQERKMEGLEKSSEENREKAELIYTRYQELEKIQDEVREAVEELGWKEAENRIKESETELSGKVNSLNEQEEFVSVSIDEYSLKLTLDEDLEAIASGYYDKAKNSEQKMEAVEDAMAETRKQLEELEQEEIEIDEVMEDKSEKRDKKWFEKYRWFYSSEGFLVLAGRDAQTNEMLVKKHMEKNDLYFHADFDGAPSVVVKDGQEAGEETRLQAAKAAVTFSKTWKAGIGADDVYCVEPDQVTEDPESGEYRERGSFIIRGERNYMRNVSVEACIGPYQIGNQYVPMCGPEKAIDHNCPEKAELRPGNNKKSGIAKELRNRFKDSGYNLDLDYIIRTMPPGKAQIT